jgi:hypothetical protein
MIHNEKHTYRHETLFLTVNILDRFLAVQKVARQRLQLVGVTSLMIAAKYEEIYPPEVRTLNVLIKDRSVTNGLTNGRQSLPEWEYLCLYVFVCIYIYIYMFLFHTTKCPC